MKIPKKNLKRILMIATGGTIASKRSEEGLKPLITSEELLGFVPDVKEFCEVTAMQIINIDSTNIQPKHWLLISSTIERFYDQYDGFVICHGTDLRHHDNIQRLWRRQETKIWTKFKRKREKDPE